jgi:hypothetical protein
MLPTKIFVSGREVEKVHPERLTGMYPKLDARLAALTEDSLSIELPGDWTEPAIRHRYLFCAYVINWDALPWMAFLGDSHYLRLLRNAVHDFQLVRSPHGLRHVPDKKQWRRVVAGQIENLDLLMLRGRIPKGRWTPRRDSLRQYLHGDG